MHFIAIYDMLDKYTFLGRFQWKYPVISIFFACSSPTGRQKQDDDHPELAPLLHFSFDMEMKAISRPTAHTAGTGAHTSVGSGIPRRE